MCVAVPEAFSRAVGVIFKMAGYPGGYGGYGPPPAQQHYPGQTGYGAAPGYHPQQSYPSAPGYGGAPPGTDPTLWNWFITVDTDRSGQISSNELQQALINGNWSHFNPETCRLMIGMFDRDQSGTINFQEFQQLWTYIQQWKGVFDRYDRDRSGLIESHELHTAFVDMGFNLSVSFVQLVISRFDVQARRSLKFDDFIQCCVMLRLLTDAFKARDTNMNGNITISYNDFMEMVLLNRP